MLTTGQCIVIAALILSLAIVLGACIIAAFLATPAERRAARAARRAWSGQSTSDLH